MVTKLKASTVLREAVEERAAGYCPANVLAHRALGDVFPVTGETIHSNVQLLTVKDAFEFRSIRTIAAICDKSDCGQDWDATITWLEAMGL